MMKQLVNFSNYPSDLDLIQNDPTVLQSFLQQHQLDGIEMMLCSPCSESFRQKNWLCGVHLRYWPCWLDFWRDNRDELLRQFGDDQQINNYYGAKNRDGWLDICRTNIQDAHDAGARYIVYHVSHARVSEVFNRNFAATNDEVIDAAIEVINELSPSIPADMALLFENLWWPGLTLQDKRLTARLFNRVNHENIGIMLDTGHLMNTNSALRTEEEGIDYVLQTIRNLAPYDELIRGIHLHKSLSGSYVEQSLQKTNPVYDPFSIMQHIMRIDEHQPFRLTQTRKILDYTQPDYLVHEFLYTSLADWSQKIGRQQKTLQMKNKEAIE